MILKRSQRWKPLFQISTALLNYDKSDETQLFLLNLGHHSVVFQEPKIDSDDKCKKMRGGGGHLKCARFVNWVPRWSLVRSILGSSK